MYVFVCMWGVREMQVCGYSVKWISMNVCMCVLCENFFSVQLFQVFKDVGVGVFAKV